MIIGKSTVSINEVVFIRLVTGEEVIGRLAEGPANTITLAKPRVMHFGQTPNGIQAGMGPIAMTINQDATVSFPITGLLALPVPVQKNVEEAYTQDTSGILPASAMKSLVR